MKRFISRLAVFLFVVSPTFAAGEGPVDYARDVKPILAEHCTSCHGPDEQESGLRLDAGKLALLGGDRGPAVVPGKSSDSLLFQLLEKDGDVPRMPLESDPLQQEQIALLKRWIDEGAKFPPDEEIAVIRHSAADHWAFQPIKRPKPPAADDPANAGWARNPIDFFLLRKLREQNLSPSPSAGPEPPIRRVSFDLTGLPPTLEEIDAFVNDARPGAYERLVDRLLASPRYGERWGRHWLDAARYADSNGYTIDGPRSIWKYRDWVIKAINSDMPFDTFTIAQIAGDLLPDATLEQVVATGFHRNTLINQEGGTDQEQFRVEAVADRVNTTGQVFLGLTVGCARCHAHKFDPISQREYYQFFDLLNQCDEPTIPVPSVEQRRRQTQVAAQLKAAEAKLKEYDAAAEQRRKEFEAKLAALPLDVKWFPLTVQTMSSAGGATLESLEDGSLLAAGKIPQSDTYEVTYTMPVRRGTALKLEALTHDGLPRKGPGLAGNGNFVLTDFQVARRTLEEPDTAIPVKIAKATADHSQSGFPIEHAFDDDPDKTGWAINVAQGSLNVDRSAVFVFPQALAENDIRLTIKLRFGHPNRYQIGRFRISVTNAAAEVLALPEDIRAALKLPAEKRTKEQQQALAVELRRNDPGRKPLQTAVNKIKAEQDALKRAVPTTMVLRKRPQPRETRIHIRGDFLRHGAIVQGKPPAVLPPFPDGVENGTRLDLARWLVDPANPLTPRVTVNRVWQRFFGRGIVATEEDFGTQGELPTHPELLDWLASELVERGWRMKSLDRHIVTSAAYRQASHVSAERWKADPFNKWLGRQSRVRVQAETIRDAALATSGLLSRVMHGPSVFPPQPDGIYRFTQNQKNWKPSPGGDRYRRGLYTYFWRSSPDPFLMTFDAPGANVACTRRVRSNTPLQALTLANDKMFVEMAQAFGLRVLKEAPTASDEGRLRFAFRLCLARQPSKWEIGRLLEFVKSQRDHFEQQPDEAKQTAAPSLPEDIPAADAAAWTAAARVLMNLDEFVTRE